MVDRRRVDGAAIAWDLVATSPAGVATCADSASPPATRTTVRIPVSKAHRCPGDEQAIVVFEVGEIRGARLRRLDQIDLDPFDHQWLPCRATGVGEDLDSRRVSCGGDEVDVDGRSMGLADGSDAHGDGEPADEHNALRLRRDERGWSQSQLAEHLGVSRQTVNAIENDRYDPSLPLAFAISAVFDEPIEGLFFPDGRADRAKEDRR